MFNSSLSGSSFMILSNRGVLGKEAMKHYKFGKIMPEVSK